MDGSVDLWRRSGCAWLTGREDGAPNDGGHPAAAYAHRVATDIGRLSATLGSNVELDGSSILAERSVHTQFRRGGRQSCNRTTQLLTCSDGHVSLTIARTEDRDLLAASFETTLAGSDDVWDFAKQQCAHRSVEEVRDRVTVLGLSAAILGEAHSADHVGHVGHVGTYAAAGTRRERPVVIDLSSLWAGPLAANVLGLVGAEIVKVESVDRPDGARRGSPTFYDLLHGGHQSVTLDFASQPTALHALLAAADVVITSARPRAFDQLGIDPDQLMREHPITAWISITGFGARQPNRIGFGDDAAIAAGLCAFDHDGPMFAADAIADPLTGLTAASIVLDALVTGKRVHADLALADVARAAAVAEPFVPGTGETSSTETAALPRSRPVRARAPLPGAHNDRWLT